MTFSFPWFSLLFRTIPSVVYLQYISQTTILTSCWSHHSNSFPSPFSSSLCFVLLLFTVLFFLLLLTIHLLPLNYCRERASERLWQCTNNNSKHCEQTVYVYPHRNPLSIISSFLSHFNTRFFSSLRWHIKCAINYRRSQQSIWGWKNELCVETTKSHRKMNCIKIKKEESEKTRK